MAKRKAISRRTRFEVFKRDRFICQYCGGHPPAVLLEVDHIMPLSKGGDGSEGNLVTACFSCNRGKAAVPLSVVPRSLPERAAEVAEREEQLAGYRDVMQARADRIEADAWGVADILIPEASLNGFSRDYLRSIKIFNDKLPLHITREAASLAADRVPFSDRRRFLYFCKVCWGKVKEGADVS